MKYNKNSGFAGFSIIEVLIGIFIFSLGLVAIYALISSSLRVNNYNKHAIVASNLAREQIELIKNIRDTNYEQLKLWNRLPDGGDITAGKYYKVLLDNNDADIVVEAKKAWGNDVSNNAIYRICLDHDKNYSYCDNITGDKIETPYYKYIEVQEAKGVSGNTIPETFTIISKVIWYSYGAHEFEIKTLLSDWRRI